MKKIEEIINHFTRINHKENGISGVCPFHNDDEDSLVINSELGVFRCPKCGAAGGAIRFLTLLGCTEKEAAELIEKEFDSTQLENSTPLFKVNSFVASFYEKQLQTQEGQAIGLSYLRSRELSDQTIATFHLGYSPAKSSIMQEAKNGDFTEENLINSGTFIRSQNGNLFDRFYGRVIFPWIDIFGRVVAFNGRKLDAATKGVEQKYVNSPTTEIYNKSEQLFGLYQARESIIQNDCVYIVEGQFDMISMYQAGIKNVVANSGTALSEQQVMLLKRFTNNVIEIYDADAAGIKAATKGINLFLAHDMNVKILLLPQGQDPDEFVRKEGKENFLDFIGKNCVDVITFKINVAGEECKKDPDLLTDLIIDVAKTIAYIKNQRKRLEFAKQSVAKFSIPLQFILAQIDTASKELKKEEVITKYPPYKEEIEQIKFVQNHINNATINSNIAFRERNLINFIFEHGHKEIATVNGEVKTTVKYIDYALTEVKEKCSTPFFHQIYNKIFDIALQQEWQDINAPLFFVNHEDHEISGMAASYLASIEPLSQIYLIEKKESRFIKMQEQQTAKKKPSKAIKELIIKQEAEKKAHDTQEEMNRLFNHLFGILEEYRNEILLVKTKQIQEKILASIDPEEQIKLMKEKKEIQNLLKK